MKKSERVRLRLLLERIQWRGGTCPDCGVMYRYRVHKEDCELRALLTEVSDVGDV